MIPMIKLRGAFHCLSLRNMILSQIKVFIWTSGMEGALFEGEEFDESKFSPFHSKGIGCLWLYYFFLVYGVYVRVEFQEYDMFGGPIPRFCFTFGHLLNTKTYQVWQRVEWMAHEEIDGSVSRLHMLYGKAISLYIYFTYHIDIVTCIYIYRCCIIMYINIGICMVTYIHMCFFDIYREWYC